MSCPTLLFPVFKESIEVGLCEDLANERAKVSFYLWQSQSIIANFSRKVKQKNLSDQYCSKYFIA